MPLFHDPTTVRFARPIGTHQFQIASYKNFLTVALQYRHWALTEDEEGSERSPRITKVEVVTSQNIILRTDAPMVEGRAYYIRAAKDSLDDGAGGTLAIPQIDFVGLKVALNSDPGDPALLVDYAQPYFDKKTGKTGSLVVNAEGDYALAGGLESLRRMCWTAILTEYGRLVHAPGFGNLPPAKRAYPQAELAARVDAMRASLAALPYVTSAEIRPERVGNTLRLTIAVDSKIGQIEETREFGQ